MTRQNLTRQIVTRQNVETVESPGHIFLWDLREGLWMNLSGKKSIFFKSMKKSKNQRIYFIVGNLKILKHQICQKKNVNNKIQNFNLNIELLCNRKKTLIKLSFIIYNLSYEL